MSQTLTRLLSLAQLGAPLLPPGSRLRDLADPLSRLRRVAREELQADASPWMLAGATCVWPLALAAQTAVNLRRNGRAVATSSGRGVREQLRDLLAMAWRHDLTPASYYRFHLFEPAARARAGRFIPEHELAAILRRVNRGLDWATLDDKVAFHEHCLRHHLPTPAVVLEAEGGELRWRDGHDRLPRMDLILKPRRLHGGQGVERWLYEPAREVWTRGDRSLLASGLLEHARSRSRAWPYLLQERIRLHPALEDLAPNGVLCTLRMVTCLPPSGGVTILEALLRMPGRPDQVVDNIAAGGAGANVDERGELGPALSGHETHEAHPITGAPIRGRRMPSWDEVRTLCARAHRTVPEFACVAWDVAVTSRGPVLIEANTLFGAPDGPLGDTAFVECALARLEQPGLPVTPPPRPTPASAPAPAGLPAGV